MSVQTDLPAATGPAEARARPPRRSAPAFNLHVDRDWLRAHWGQVALWLGAALLATPTLIANAQRDWSSEQGEHGPIVLAIGLWLLWRRWGAMRAVARPGAAWLAWAVGLALGAVFLFARIADEIRTECYALYGLGLVTLYGLMGWRAMIAGAFPLVYLALALPMPAKLTWELTYHLRIGITEAAAHASQLIGWNVVRDGLELVVDNYRLAVKEACSGMNSLISLTAIGMIYVYIRRAPPWAYIAAMLAPVFAFAVIGNFTRVMVLIALTHFFGDEVAQSYLHETAGLLTFTIALLGVIGVDALMAPLVLRPAARRAAA